MFGTAAASWRSELSGPAHGRRPRLGMHSRSETLVRFSRYIDAMLVAAIFAFVLHPNLRQTRGQFLASLLVVPCWMLMLRYFGLYESHRIDGLRALVRNLVSAHLLGGLLAGCAAAAIWGWSGVRDVLIFLIVTTTLLFVQKTLLRVVLSALRWRGFDHRRICVIGNRADAHEIANECRLHPGWGLEVGFIGIGEPEHREYYSFPDNRAIGPDLEQILRTDVLDEVVVVVPPTESLSRERGIMALCEQYGLLGRLLPLTLDPEISDAEVSDFHGTISFGVGGLRQNNFEVVLKRGIDLLLAALLLILLLPLMVVTAILVKLSSPGPAIFTQYRVGLRGRKFKILKFRSMVDGAETIARTMGQPSSIARGPIFKDSQDWRVTPIGRVLRRFSVDELPQLWNVIRGEMSMVGPRPLPLNEAQAISGSFRKRFSMRPGITCVWQVNGRSDVGYTQWMKYDLEYIDGWSLWLDLKLLLKTVPVVLARRGAY